MMVRLPLNPMPIVRTYTNDLFLNAIASANCGDSDLLASLNIIGFQSDNYAVLKTDNASLYFDNNKVKICGTKSNKPTRVFIHRKFSLGEEFVVKITSQQYTSCWSSLNIFAANNKVNLNDDKFTCRIGMFSNGRIRRDCYGKLDSVVDRKYSIRKPYYLKIALYNNNIEGCISLDGNVWDTLCRSLIDDCDNQEVGIDLNFDPNTYWEWMYTSYINIYFNINWGLHINYLTAPMRNYNFNSINPLIYFKRENPHFILDRNESFVEYIISNIEHGQYVELYFDEFFIPHSLNYQSRHFLHGILAYGFDGTDIYFLGVQNGKPIEFTLSYKNVEMGCLSSIEINDINTFIIYEFLPEKYLFNVTALYKAIRDYLSNAPDNIFYYNLDDVNNVYGINIFDEITSKAGLDVFMSDIRIPFLIDEHTRLMRERIKYLISSDILTKNEGENILCMLNSLCENTNKVLLLTLKHSITGSSNIPLKVSGMLKDIKCQQKLCYSKLLCLLKKHVDNSRIEFFGDFK